MREKKDILKGEPLPLFLLKCKTDFKFFAENCLEYTSNGEKIAIQPFQMKWVEEAMKADRIIIESGTGSSKTETMGAMFPIWRMFNENNLRVLLVCKTKDQSSSNLLSRIKRYIDDNVILKELFIPDDYENSWNASEIKTKNGCWVRIVPYNVNIRSFRGDLIIADELDSYDDENIFFEHVLSRLTPHGKLVGISTPVGPTKIIGQLKERAKLGMIKGWSFIRTPYLVDDEGKPAKIENREDIWHYQSIWPEMWSLQKLYDRWGAEQKANWLRNIMCESVGEIDDAIFPFKNITSSYDFNRGFSDKVNPEAMYFIGADFAISDGPKADFDAFIVVEKLADQYIIKTMETHKGWQRQEKINRLKELYYHYESSQGVFIVVDESNMGTMVMNDLRNIGIPVIAQAFHTSARKKIIINLGTVFSGKGLIIPRDPRAEDECVKYSELLKEQLVGFKRKKSDRSGDDLVESKAAHDDLVMALAMAISEAVQHGTMDSLPISG